MSRLSAPSGHANADFTGALLGGIGNHTINSDCGEDGGHQSPNEPAKAATMRSKTFPNRMLAASVVSL